MGGGSNTGGSGSCIGPPCGAALCICDCVCTAFNMPAEAPVCVAVVEAVVATLEGGPMPVDTNAPPPG